MKTASSNYVKRIREFLSLDLRPWVIYLADANFLTYLIVTTN